MKPDLEHAAPHLNRAVAVLRGMAYQHRLHILLLLQEGESTPGTLTEAIDADPTSVAHHLRYLLDARLVRRRRRGRNVYYSLHGAATGRLVTEILRYAETSG
jgi:DNA-binding transcriptional ArsR family regulator